jgi:hypothetical protein
MQASHTLLLLGSVLALVMAAAEPAAAVGISPQGRVFIEGVIDLVDPAADPNFLGIEVGDPFSIEAVYNAALLTNVGLETLTPDTRHVQNSAMLRPLTLRSSPGALQPGPAQACSSWGS